MADLRLTALLAGSATAAAGAPLMLSAPVRPAVSRRAAPAARSSARVTPAGRPWRWVVHTDSLDLYADGGPPWTAGVPDPLVLVDCGVALHRTRVALVADGVAASVRLRPDRDPDHVATLVPTGTATIERYAPAGGPVGALLETARAEGVSVRRLDRSEVVRLAASTPLTRPATTRLERGEVGVYCVLFGDSADAPSWLRAGAALSAVWHEADRRRLSVTVSASVVSLPGGQALLRELLPAGSTAHLALRIDAS